MKKLKDFDLKGKRVLMRCDFNIPFSDKGEILDEFRIKKTIPTINYLIEQGAKIILISHLEGKGERPSLKIVIPGLEKILGKKIKFLPDCRGQIIKEEIVKMKEGQIFLLENLRFQKEEKENDLNFSKDLSELGDIFVNEAFSVSHRAHASIVGPPQYLPSTIGFLFEKEIEVLSNLLEKPEHPFVTIIGGIKIETKIKPILNIIKKADHLLLGSKIGEIMLAGKNILIGRDLKEERLIEKIDLTDKKIHLPLDGVIALRDTKEPYLRKGGVGTLRKEEEIFDIGPETVKFFKKIIKTAKTILWSGPVGMYEDKRFEEGTKEVAEAIVRNYSAFKVAGGGDTVSALKKFNLSDKFDFLSTGGGAMLEFLSGDILPGLKALEDNN